MNELDEGTVLPDDDPEEEQHPEGQADDHDPDD